MIMVGAPTDLLGDAKFGLHDFDFKFCEVPDPDPKRNSKCKNKYYKAKDQTTWFFLQDLA